MNKLKIQHCHSFIHYARTFLFMLIMLSNYERTNPNSYLQDSEPQGVHLEKLPAESALKTVSPDVAVQSEAVLIISVI